MWAADTHTWRQLWHLVVHLPHCTMTSAAPSPHLPLHRICSGFTRGGTRGEAAAQPPLLELYSTLTHSTLLPQSHSTPLFSIELNALCCTLPMSLERGFRVCKVQGSITHGGEWWGACRCRRRRRPAGKQANAILQIQQILN